MPRAPQPGVTRHGAHQASSRGERLERARGCRGPCHETAKGCGRGRGAQVLAVAVQRGRLAGGPHGAVRKPSV